MLHYGHMTRTLDQALRRMKALPQERQDDLGEIILTLVEQDRSDFELSDAQVQEVKRRLANPGALVPFEAVLARLDFKP
jgi:hypothetical protein